MKALRKLKSGAGNVDLVEVCGPEPREGQVMVKVERAGICGTDLHILHGRFAKARPPVTLGHEFAGRVVAVGSGVEGWLPGDRVAVETEAYSCGKCGPCRCGWTNLCGERIAYGYGVDGGFASLVAVRHTALHRLPAHVSFSEAALCEPLAVAVHAVTECAKVNPGDLVMVTGAGPIGQLVMQLAKTAGAKVVMTGVKGDEARLDVAGKLGADFCLKSDKEDLFDLVQSLTDGEGASLAFECAGSAAALNDCLACVGRTMQVVQIGLFGRYPEIDLSLLALKEINLRGAFGHHRETWNKAIGILAEREIQLQPLISGELPLHAWQQAFHLAETGNGLKYLLYPED